MFTVARGLWLAVFSTAIELCAQSKLQQAVADLADARLRRDACSALLEAGQSAVEPLRSQLILLDSAAPEVLSATLYVLGQLGRDGVSALPEVLHAYEMGIQPLVRRQAMWAIGQLAPLSPDKGACSACLAAIERYAAADIDQFLADVVIHRLRLGASPASSSLAMCLDSGPAGGIAVSEALLAVSSLGGAERARLIAELEILFNAAQREYEWPWDNGSRYRAARGAMAATLWHANIRTASVALGLLSHWDPVVRLAGINAVAHASTLSVRERLQVASLLTDDNQEVRDMALGTLIGWGGAAVVAIPRLAEASHGANSPGVGVACKHAIRRIVKDSPCTGIVEAARLAVEERRVERIAEVPKDVCAAGALADMVTGCRGLTDGSIVTLAEFVSANDLATADVIDGFVYCLGTESGEAWNDAIRALVRLGPIAFSRRPNLDVLILRATSISQAPLRTAAIAEAWVRAGPTATASQLCDAIASEKWYVALRGLAELVRRGTPPLRAVELAAGCRERNWKDIEISQGAEWTAEKGYGGAFVTMTADTASVKALAMLLLFCAKDTRWIEFASFGGCASALGLPGEDVMNELRVLAEKESLQSPCEHAEAVLRCSPFVK